jgi:hypothetical protein
MEIVEDEGIEFIVQTTQRRFQAFSLKFVNRDVDLKCTIFLKRLNCPEFSRSALFWRVTLLT